MKILISAHSLGIAAIGDMYLKEDNDYKRRKESCETRILTALIIISQLRKFPHPCVRLVFDKVFSSVVCSLFSVFHVVEYRLPMAQYCISLIDCVYSSYLGNDIDKHDVHFN